MREAVGESKHIGDCCSVQLLYPSQCGVPSVSGQPKTEKGKSPEENLALLRHSRVRAGSRDCEGGLRPKARWEGGQARADESNPAHEKAL